MTCFMMTSLTFCTRSNFSNVFKNGRHLEFQGTYFLDPRAKSFLRAYRTAATKDFSLNEKAGYAKTLKTNDKLATFQQLPAPFWEEKPPPFWIAVATYSLSESF